MPDLTCDNVDCPFEGNHPADRRGWHLERGLDIGHVLLTLCMAAGFLVWALSQEKRVTTIENNQANDHALLIDHQQQKVRSDDQTEKRLQRIEDKLDIVLGASRGK